MTGMNDLLEALLTFRDERNWKQFHTLKNLIVSLNLEASELLELTQWKTDEALEALTSDDRFRADLKDECADIFLYLLLIAEHTGIDLLDAAQAKLRKNAERYPVGLAYGSSRKYSELGVAKKAASGETEE